MALRQHDRMLLRIPVVCPTRRRVHRGHRPMGRIKGNRMTVFGTPGYGDDLFPKLDKEKFRQELRDIYYKTKTKGSKPDEDGPDGGRVREPRKPKPSEPGDSVEVELPV